jgi:transcriptional regulator of acetoin/glycerol metabolism
VSDANALPAVKIRRLWDEFTEGRNPSLDVLDPGICNSWTRSAQYGIDARLKTPPLVRSVSELQGMLEQSSLYRASAVPMRMVSSALTGRGGIAILLDADGVLLDLMGDSRTVEKAAEIGTVPGCKMSEDSIGTDAIALSLSLEKPATVAFYEHYLEIGHQWAGSSAPLHHPSTGELLGCLSIYGHGDAAHPAALKFVTTAAEMIERELEAQEMRARFILLQNYESRRAKSPNSELLCVSREGIAFAGSPIALNLLGFSNAPAGDLRGFLRILDVKRANFEQRTEPQEIELLTKRGDLLKAELLPVVHQQELIGFVGVLPTNDARVGRLGSASPWRANYTFADILGGESGIADCISEAKKIASENWPVLVTGESGTGKELFAHAIHNASPRRGGPFVPVNCGGVSDELLSAEVFGYADGAFTGASRGGKAGKMELAHGGTLFLDEAETMSPRMQVHLLRVLEEGRVIPVGAEKPKTVDVRIVAATNVDLEEKIKDGSFRPDLYYRLSVSTITVPPLRERKADVIVLANHFASSIQGFAIHPEAMECLTSYCWPGNVRQLRNIIQQASMRATGRLIRSYDLPSSVCGHSTESCDRGFALPQKNKVAPPVGAPANPRSLHTAERDAILRALSECGGNISKASLMLGVHRVTLHRKMEAFGITAVRTFG